MRGEASAEDPIHMTMYSHVATGFLLINDAVENDGVKERAKEERQK